MLHKRCTKYMRSKSRRKYFKKTYQTQGCYAKVLKYQQEEKVWLKTDPDLTGHSTKEDMQK